ncbi:type IV pilus modification protein PilV [Thermomonas sp.]|uniref:type IV pilus modification PilV family protein n=1 Tax=Thermomonas sp. TaxID=1971895 RepID=UPI0035AD8BD5
MKSSFQMNRPARSRGRHLASSASMRGVGLLEVLISVLVLSIGLLGIAAMQSVALRGGQGSLESSQAVMQATSIIEAMRANRPAVAAYNMPAMQCTVPAGGTLAQNDIRDWITSLQATMGGGNTTCAQITAAGGDVYRIVVQWDDQRAGDDATRQMVTETRI